MDTWDNDPTQQKVHAQNCTLKCTSSYSDDVTTDFLACMFDYNCVAFPPINVTCPRRQLTENTASNSSLHDLSGMLIHFTLAKMRKSQHICVQASGGYIMDIMHCGIAIRAITSIQCTFTMQLHGLIPFRAKCIW